MTQTGAAETDEQFAALVADKLAVIEDALMRAAVSDNPFVTEAAQHLVSAGGKRFRPSLVIAASQFGPDTTDERLTAASLVVELTHVASLYHDDVMDEADLRRGVESANHRYGNSVAILVGDFLFARASAVVAGLGSEFIALQAQTFAELVEGQIAETTGPGPDIDPVAHHIKVLEGKTASLIRTSALFGGMVAGAQPDVLAALGEYGFQIGLVFQLSDDLIDITSDVTGKTPGTDLREGIPTLPTLLLAASEDPADQELSRRIAGDLSDDAVLADVLAQLRANPVIDQARAEVQRRADAAREALVPLPDGPAKRSLLQVCDEIVDRAR